MTESTGDTNTFMRDVKTLRDQARQSLNAGAVTPDYENVEKAIALLQGALATEIVCVLRYTMNAITVSGLASRGVAAEFTEHADEERQHMMMLAERIDQLGGTPDLNPASLTSRSASEYGHGGTLVEMIEQNLVAERIAIEHYRDLIQYFTSKDPTTRLMLETILKVEEEHASDMHDLLVAHQGTPSLK